MVQLIGDAAWAAAGRPDPGVTITAANVRIGRGAMEADLEALSVPRARLIDKGFLQASLRGTLEFTIPGFAQFVRDLGQD
ncbi:hypothetical protein ABH924_000357 [Arthrobacter sp. GAS37]|uniref:hypothetical protein n=1 Tax=Arthrobacter sp. GAS37 TaxID=3156261 RepID=UPI003832FBD9